MVPKVFKPLKFYCIYTIVADRSHHAFCADVSSSGSINELMQNIQSAFKEVPTIAVNSAGITKDAMMLKMSEENFDRVIDVNLKVLHVFRTLLNVRGFFPSNIHVNQNPQNPKI